MIAETNPLAEITQDAIRGNYTEERRELFADQTLDDLINEIKQRRTRRASNQLPQTETP